MFQRVLLDFVLKTFGLGAENETRTRDPNLGKVVLYQLSYFRICLRSRCSSSSHCQGWIILSSWGKVVLYQLSYFRNNFRTVRPDFPIASANIRQIFLLCKKFLKNLHFWCVFLQKPPFLHTISAQNRRASPPSRPN